MAQQTYERLISQPSSDTPDGRIETPELLASEIEDRFEQAVDHKRPHEAFWLKDIAFLMGNQWSDWVDGIGLANRGGFRPGTRSTKRELVFNLIEPALRTAVSRLIAKKPWLQAMPRTSDAEDAQSARTATQLLRFWRQRIFNSNRMTMAGNWLCTTGTVFFRTGWDENAGTLVNPRPRAPAESLITATDQSRPSAGDSLFQTDFDRFYNAFASPAEESVQPPSDDRDDRRLARGVGIREGDVILEVVNPFELYPQPNVDDWERIAWCIQARKIDREASRELWGDDLADKMETTDQSEHGGFDERNVPGGVTSRSYAFGSLFGIRNRAEKDQVLVLEYWERPSDRRPRGRRSVVVGGQLVMDGDNPYPFQDFPVVPAYYQRIPGQLWGRGLVEAMIPAQQQFNTVLSQLSEAMEYSSHPKWLMPRMANISKAVGRNVPGEMWEYSGGLPPTVLNAPGMPAFMGTILQTHHQLMQDVSHQHAASRGEAPPNVEAGIALQVLQEGDMAPMRAMHESFDEALRVCGLYMLMIAQERYNNLRVARLMGAGGQPDVIEFMGADIRGVGDVHVEERSAIPDSLPGRRQFILELHDRGLFGNPGDPIVNQRTLTALEFGQFQPLFDEKPSFEELFMQQLMQIAQAPGGLERLLQQVQTGAAPSAQPPAGP